MEKHQLLISAALSSGATKAAIIPGEKIVTSEHFREMCAANHCGVYGQCWQCPPEIGEISELISQVKQFPYGLLYQSVSEIEDSFDIEGMEEASRRHAQTTQRIREEMRHLLKEDFLHLGSGGCGVCKTCAKRDNLPCRFPEKAMSSMEGYGIDVYTTTKSTDLKYINGQNTVTYFGIVLFTE